MKITVKRVIALLCLFCGLLLLPACMAEEAPSTSSEGFCSTQPIESQSIEMPARTLAKAPAESFNASDSTADLSDTPSLAPDIPERTSNAENRVPTVSEISSVPLSEMCAAPQTASSPSEETSQPGTSAPEFPDTPPQESSVAPSVQPMDSAYLCNLLSGVNLHRSGPLDMDADLSAAAQAHALEMAQTKSLYHSCSGVESVGKGAFDDGVKEGSLLTVHCSDLASEELIRIGVGAAKDEDGSIYVCILGKTY